MLLYLCAISSTAETQLQKKKVLEEIVYVFGKCNEYFGLKEVINIVIRNNYKITI